MNNKQMLRQGDVVTVTLPYSEVCVHMRVAGKVYSVLVLRNAAQILRHDGTPFSAPITLGEAGIYLDECGRKYVPAHLVTEHKPCPQTTVILYVTRKRGERIIECSKEHIIDACLDRYVGDFNVTFEDDEMGRRYRVTLPNKTNAVLVNPSPAERLVKLAASMRIPAALEV